MSEPPPDARDDAGTAAGEEALRADAAAAERNRPSRAGGGRSAHGRPTGELAGQDAPNALQTAATAPPPARTTPHPRHGPGGPSAQMHDRQPGEPTSDDAPCGPQAASAPPPAHTTPAGEPLVRGERTRQARAGRRGFVARAAAVTAGLSVAGSVLGLVRDQVIARLFGAGAGSDAFLVAWTVPELAATVLIEDAMALLLVPAFSAALARGGTRALIRGTLPRLAAVLAAATAALYAAAPLVVHLLAPGLADPRLATACTRLTASTVLAFGLTGYLSAALRAHHVFLPPAAVYVAYNVGIVATLLVRHGAWGVRSAAAGVAAGGALMVLVQLPSFVRAVRGGPAPSGPATAVPRQRRPRAQMGAALVVPVVVFAVSRQAQVLVERYFAAGLPSGAISHLNYAQKVAQLPMAMSLMVCLVTFPAVSRALATGDGEGARRRVERDLTLACLVVLLGTAYVLACSPQIVHTLFQRGAFTAADTAATAGVMRVYALGLLGQSLVGALIRPYFSAARPTWYPVAAMAAGLALTGAADAAAVTVWGVYGIAAGNAAGISLTAALLLRGLPARAVPVRLRVLGAMVGRYMLAAAAAAAAGLCTARALPLPAAGTVAACCLTVPLAFAAAAAAVGAPLRSLTHAA